MRKQTPGTLNEFNPICTVDYKHILNTSDGKDIPVDESEVPDLC